MKRSLTFGALLGCLVVAGALSFPASLFAAAGDLGTQPVVVVEDVILPIGEPTAGYTDSMPAELLSGHANTDLESRSSNGVQPVPVPEPGSLLMILAGIANVALYWAIRRRIR